MFNLLPLLFTCFVLGIAHPDPAVNSIANKLLPPTPSPSLLASINGGPSASSNAPNTQQSNTISSDESTKELTPPDDLPAANTNSATAAAAPAASPANAAVQSEPASVTRLSVSAAANGNSASASASRSGLSVSSATKSGGNTAATTVQHHILPAETLPLPITISTRPGLRTIIAPETITIHEPTIAKVGEVVQKIPTSVSHQSQTVVHKHARVVTPIVAPAVRTTTSQVWRAYHTPLLLAPQTTVVRVLSDSESLSSNNNN